MHPSSGPVHRVKVYKLKADGQWDDKGTGHVSVEVLQRQESLGLVVVSEDDTRKPLLIHRISQGEISYERQGDTILTWNDLQLRTDVALSFEETSGCEAVWDAIDQVQKGSYHGQGHSDSPVSRHMVDEYDQVQHHQDGQMSEMCPSGPVELPAPEMGNLEEITRILTELQVQQKESMAAFLRKDGYIKRLLDLFQQLEDLENQEGLTLMFRSVKSIILLNDSALYEELLKEDNVMHVVGALEYDPDVGRCNHREFLRDKVLFKEVIPIADGEVKAKIHQTYRMGYLKDVILPRVLDDSTFAMIHSMMMFNCMDILQSLHADATYLNQLFQQLREQKPSEPHWEDLVSFTQELCSLAKHLQPHLRAELFTRLLDLGLLEVEEKILEHGGPEVRLKATDILLSLIQHDPSPLRAYMVKHNSLLDLLVQDILAGGDSGLAEQNIQLLKILLDEETMEQNQDKNLFMDLFYNSFIGKLLVAIGPAGSSSGSAAREAVAAAAKADGDAAGTAGPGTRPAGDAAVGAGRTMSAHVIGLIVDLLSFCVQHHKYRIKYYALKNGLLARVLHLIKRPEKWLVVAAIRFLKICIGMKDEFYIRDVLRNNLLDPVINAFVANGDRYNLLNSTVLELVEFIRKETVTKRLVAYICEQPHWQEPLCGITYVDTFKQLRERYDSDQISALDADGKGTDAAARSEWLEQRRRRGPREMEKDEEDYFSERSDDEDTATAHPTSARPAAARAQRSDGEGGGGGSGGGAGGSHSGVGGRVVEGASSSWAAEESDVFGPPCPPDVGTRGDGGGSAPAGPHSFANGATSEQGCRPAFSLWKSVEKPPEDSAVPGPGIGSSSIGGWVDADADPGESALAQDASNGLLVPVVGRKRPAASAMDAEAGVRSAAAPAPGAARPPQAAQPQQVPGSNDIGEGALPLVDYGDEEDDDADAGDGAPPPPGDADGKLLLRGGTSGDAPRKQLKLDSEGLAPA